MKKIGFIGLGNMSSAIIKGMIESGNYAPTSIYGYNRTEQKATILVEQLQIQKCDSIEQLVSLVDIIIVGVKPQNLDEVLPQIQPLLKPEQMIISIAAGKTLETLQSYLPQQAVFRVMPNINAIVGASTSCYCTNVQQIENKQIVEQIFASVGTIIELDESLFSTFTTIGCSSPAFTYMYIDALARAAVKEGMNKQLALQIAASSVLGSAKMILNSDNHPFDLVDQVCSPGGTTIEGVLALQENGFEHAIHAAVKAVGDKDTALKAK